MQVYADTSGLPRAIERLTKRVLPNWREAKRAAVKEMKDGVRTLSRAVASETKLLIGQSKRRIRFADLRKGRRSGIAIRIATSLRAGKIHIGRLKTSSTKRGLRAGGRVYRKAFVFRGKGEKERVLQRTAGGLEPVAHEVRVGRAYRSKGRLIVRRVRRKMLQAVRNGRRRR